MYSYLSIRYLQVMFWAKKEPFFGSWPWKHLGSVDLQNTFPQCIFGQLDKESPNLTFLSLNLTSTYSNIFVIPLKKKLRSTITLPFINNQ